MNLGNKFLGEKVRGSGGQEGLHCPRCWRERLSCPADLCGPGKVPPDSLPGAVGGREVWPARS